MGKHQVGPGGDTGTHQKEGRGRDIRRNIDTAAAEPAVTPEADAIVVTFDFVAKAPQHPFRMVAGGCRLGDTGTTVRIQAGQQQAGFHLRTGDRQAVIDTLQSGTAANTQRRGAGVRGHDGRTHQPQRFGHAAHGPFGKRGIPGQFDVECLTGQQTAHQAHGSAGIAQIQRSLRRPQPMQADTAYADMPVRRTVDGNSEITKRLQGGQTVLAFQEAGDFRAHRRPGNRA